MKNSSGFSKLNMYAESKGKILNYSIKKENLSWQTIRIEHIPVKSGKVEIDFSAAGTANAFCYADDVSLVKSR